MTRQEQQHEAATRYRQIVRDGLPVAPASERRYMFKRSAVNHGIALGLTLSRAVVIYDQELRRRERPYACREVEAK
jgi:hypothetical protein